MAQVVANVAFWHAGRKIHVGDIIDSAEDLYVLYPTRFTAQYNGATTVVGTVGTTAGTLGSLVAARSVLNSGGTIIGYEPLYDTIVP